MKEFLAEFLAGVVMVAALWALGIAMDNRLRLEAAPKYHINEPAPTAEPR